jgi:aryl-alcohol dehydrogenase-like predicted oxidoreductase
LARGRLARPWDAPSSTNRTASDATAARLYSATETEDKSVIDVVGAVADSQGLTRAQVALAWLLQQPGVTTPIIGATKPTHLDEALNALSIQLQSDDCAALERLYVPHAMSYFPS